MMKAGTLRTIPRFYQLIAREEAEERKERARNAHVNGETSEPDDRVGWLVGHVEGDGLASLDALREEPVREAVDLCEQ